MQKYHYTDGTNTFGPFTVEELQHKGITADTFVWTDGLSTWVAARQLPELASIIQQGDQPYFTAGSQPPPPQFPNSGAPRYRETMGRPPKTYLLETILTTILCCLPLGIPSIIYASRVESRFYAGDIAGAEEASANAKKWMYINLGVSVLLWILNFSIFGLAFFGAMFDGATSGF